MNRRQLLAGLIAAPAVAVAAHFKAPEWMGEEIREELITDLSRTSIQVPGQVFDNRPVWTSVSGVRKVWVEHVAKELSRRIDRDILDKLAPRIDRTVNAMVRAVDLDLRKAEVSEDMKTIILPPKVNLTGEVNSFTREPVFELKAGLASDTNILGDITHKVGYIQESIII